MIDAVEGRDASLLTKSAPEAKRAHHASETADSSTVVTSEAKKESADAVAQQLSSTSQVSSSLVAGADAVAQVGLPSSSPAVALENDVPLTESLRLCGNEHRPCRSVDVYTKLAEIGKGTYGFVVVVLLLFCSL